MFEISEEAKACLKEKGVELPEFKGGEGGPPAGGNGEPPEGFEPPEGGEMPEGGPSGGEGGPGGEKLEEQKAAFEECGVEMPEFKGGPGGEGGKPNTNSAAFKKQINEYVACVRENGYELAEPNFSGEGPIFEKAESESAEFKKASAQCQELLGGPQGARNPAEQAGQLTALRVGEARGDRLDLRLDFGRARGDDRPPTPGELDPHGAAVVGVGDAFDQAPFLRPVDEAGDARLVELQEAGEEEGPRFAVAEDAEQAHLDDREVLARRDPSHHALDQERGLDEGVDEGRGLRASAQPSNLVGHTNQFC